MRGDRSLGGPSLERRISGEHLEPDYSERIDVRPMVRRRICRSLLGRHIRECAERYSARSEGATAILPSGVGQRLGNTEISDDRCVAGEHDVLRLDVTMNNTVCVRIRQRRGDVPEYPQCVGDRQLALSGKPCAKRFTFDERHREERQPVGLASGEQRDDVRMLQPRRKLDLSLEPREADCRRHFGG